MPCVQEKKWPKTTPSGKITLSDFGQNLHCNRSIGKIGQCNFWSHLQLIGWFCHLSFLTKNHPKNDILRITSVFLVLKIKMQKQAIFVLVFVFFIFKAKNTDVRRILAKAIPKNGQKLKWQKWPISWVLGIFRTSLKASKRRPGKKGGGH